MNSDSAEKNNHIYILPFLLGTAILLSLWFSGRSVNAGPPGFPLDDAWIHLVYARGLSEHGYFAYNNLIPSTGSTAPLWSIILALVHVIFGSISIDALVMAVIVSGAVLCLTGIAVTTRLIQQVTGSTYTSLAGGAILALSTPYSAASFSGMEVTLTGTLLLLGVWSLTAEKQLQAGIWLALAGLARPETAVVTLLLTAVVGVQHIRTGKTWIIPVARIIIPCAVAAFAAIGYNLWASGLPFPATFYAKQSSGFVHLPSRLYTALFEIFTNIPPFTWGIGWLGIIGFLPMFRSQFFCKNALLPLAGGASFIVANLVVIRPDDPQAFYHIRYLLPAVPLLIAAVTIGALRLGSPLQGLRTFIPIHILLAFSILGAGLTLAPQSRHYHNDVRNINEVQRRIGKWLAETFPPGTWIAASDAGAVRYFSKLPTIDVLGLNTAEMLKHNEAFISAHPVAAVVLMPAWFWTPDRNRLEVVLQASTGNYTVTSNPGMATQFVLQSRLGIKSRFHFSGLRSFQLDILPVGG